MEIYMHPKRQQILHELSVQGPMTAKMLSSELDMTPSSAKHHLLRLQELGVVEVDHTQLIHGITATYFRKVAITISFSTLAEENKVVASNFATKQVYDRFYEKERKGFDENGHFLADQLSGVIHLREDEADELYKLIRSFLDDHEGREKGTVPFSYALVAYHV